MFEISDTKFDPPSDCTWTEGDLGGVMEEIQKFRELRRVSVILD